MQTHDDFYCPGWGCELANECERTVCTEPIVPHWFMPIPSGQDCQYFLPFFEDD